MEKKSESKEEQKEHRYLRREFSYSKFQQTMILPDDVDKEKIAAGVEHGVLTIDLPKLSLEEIKKAERTIEIKLRQVTNEKGDRSSIAFFIILLFILQFHFI